MRLGLLLLAAAFAAGGASHVRRLETSPLAPGLKGRPLARVEPAREPCAPLEIEARPWRLCLGSDAGFTRYFATLSSGGKSKTVSLSPPRRLTRDGVLLELADGTAYRFRIKPRRRSPIRDSKVIAEKADGLAVASWTSGELIDALSRAATPLAPEEGSMVLAYVTDRDAASGEPKATRSLVFFEPRRFIPKAWRLPAAEVTEKGVVVSLGRSRLSLRLAGGVLVVEELL